MGKGRRFWDHMIEQAGIDPETLPSQPIVEIAGERRMLIENHQGVAAYGKDRILIHVRFGAVCVCGCNLEIVHMTKEQLIICGRIESVALQRRR